MNPNHSEIHDAPAKLADTGIELEKNQILSRRFYFLLKILGGCLVLASIVLNEWTVSLILNHNISQNAIRLKQLDSMRLIVGETGIVLLLLAPFLQGLRYLQQTWLGIFIDILPTKGMILALCPLLIVLDLYWCVACVCDQVPFYLPMTLISFVQTAVISGSMIFLLAYAVSRITHSKWLISLAIVPWAVLYPVETLIYYYGGGRLEARYFGMMTSNSVGGFLSLKVLLFLVLGIGLCLWSGWLVAKEAIKMNLVSAVRAGTLLLVAWGVHVTFLSYWTQSQFSLYALNIAVLDRHYQHLKTIKTDPVWHLIAEMYSQNTEYQMVRDWGKFQTPIKYYDLPLGEKQPTPLGQPPFKRVILVLNESFSAFFLRSFNPQLPETVTPFLDSPEIQEHMLKNHHATNQPTREGVAATLCSHPNPYLVMRSGFPNSMPRILRKNGWQTAYMNPVTYFFDDQGQKALDAGFQKVFCLEQLSQREGASDYISKWGLCDRILFQYAVDYLKSQRDRQIFMTIITCDTHGPVGRENYHDLEYPPVPAWVSDYPDCVGEITTFYRSDYNLKLFFKSLQDAGLYDEDTLLILTADHCCPSHMKLSAFPGVENSPFARIPLVLLSPRSLPPFRENGGTSQLDVAPSLLHLLGLPIPEGYWGRSFFQIDEPAAPFVGFFNSKINIERDGETEVFNLGNAMSEKQKALEELFNSYQSESAKAQ
jgi:phosphoglycerol transferase MdoB-like AlkP superfamily enzyme